MSLAQETPLAELLTVPRPLQRLLAASFLQHHEGVRDNLQMAQGTSPQCSWAGGLGKEGLESPGCEVSHHDPYRDHGVSDCPRPSRVADSFQNSSVPAPGTPSRTRSGGEGQGACSDPPGVAPHLVSQDSSSVPARRRSTTIMGFSEPEQRNSTSVLVRRGSLVPGGG